jgi:hypothetical protein
MALGSSAAFRVLNCLLRFSPVFRPLFSICNFAFTMSVCSEGTI